MTSIALLPIAKEIRALAFPWLACAMCLVVPAIADVPRWLAGISVPAYFLGTAALGALSIGHEYSDRTLTALLTLPVHRMRLFASKLGVLAVMLILLWGVAYLLVFDDARFPQSVKETGSWVPVLCGVFLAPWLTMLGRSAIGGAVFTMGIEGTLFVAGELIGTRLYGSGDLMEAFRLAFAWYGTLVLCAIGAVAVWPTFARLEAIDRPDQHVQLPHWLRGSAAADTSTRTLTRRHPVWVLVKKELHLQQLPLGLAALFVITWPVARWVNAGADSGYEALLDACIFLYAGFIPMVIGASASAGERQIGVVEWQAIQPIATSRQWAVKVAVVFGLALTLAVVVPTMLLQFADPDAIMRPTLFARPDQMLLVALLLVTTGSLYVSTLCSNGLWALVMSIPAIVGAAAFFQSTWERVGHATFRIGTQLTTLLAPPESIAWMVRGMAALRLLNSLTLLLTAAFVMLVLRYALTNHRSAERTPRHIFTQLITLALFVTAEIICFSTTTAVVVWMNQSRLP